MGVFIIQELRLASLLSSDVKFPVDSVHQNFRNQFIFAKLFKI